MTDSDASVVKAPLLIRIFGWGAIVYGIATAFSIAVTGGAFSPARSGWNAISYLLAAASGYGFLKLRRWGPALYFSLFFINVILFYWLWPPSPDAVARLSTPIAIVALVIRGLAVGSMTAFYWARFS